MAMSQSNAAETTRSIVRGFRWIGLRITVHLLSVARLAIPFGLPGCGSSSQILLCVRTGTLVSAEETPDHGQAPSFAHRS